MGVELDSGVTEAGRIANEAFAGSVGAVLDPASPPPRPLRGAPRRWREGRFEPVGGGGSTLAIVMLG